MTIKRAVWKYTIEWPKLVGTFEMPMHALFRAARGVNSDGSSTPSIELWYEVDPEMPKESVRVMAIGTGFYFSPDRMTYIDTVFVDGDVWHLYWDWRAHDGK